jgi:hypothetical protein
MKQRFGAPQPVQGYSTGTNCPVCGDAVLRQESFGTSGAQKGHRLVCSRRGCPWQAKAR